MLGETPLYEAGINGHVEVVESLISNGANVSLYYDLYSYCKYKNYYIILAYNSWTSNVFIPNYKIIFNLKSNQNRMSTIFITYFTMKMEAKLLPIILTVLFQTNKHC